MEGSEKKKGSSWFLKSKEATLFVFPDGKYGSKGYSKYIIEPQSKKQLIQITITPTIKLTQELIKSIKHQGQIKKNLKTYQKFSSKYEDVIRDILNYPQQLIFVYCSSVKGSGALLFLKYLNYLDFPEVMVKNQVENNIQNRKIN